MRLNVLLALCLFTACAEDDVEVLPAPECLDPFAGYLNPDCDAYVTHRLDSDTYTKFYRFRDWWVFAGANELRVRSDPSGPDHDSYTQVRLGVHEFLEQGEDLFVCTERGMFRVTIDGFIESLNERGCQDLQPIDDRLVVVANHAPNLEWDGTVNGIYEFSPLDTSYGRLDVPVAELEDHVRFAGVVAHRGHYFAKAEYGIEVGVLEYDTDWNFVRLHHSTTTPALDHDFQLHDHNAQLFTWKNRLFLFARNGSVPMLYEKKEHRFELLRFWQSEIAAEDNIDWRLRTILRERFVPRADTLYCPGDGGLVKFYESDADTLRYTLTVDPNLPTNIWADLHFDNHETMAAVLINHQFLVERNCAE